MNLSRVDLNLFVVFEAIYTLGSITAAGRKLNLSQSAVSHALARLRSLFDDPLFERSSRGMAPTPLARALIIDVRDALQRMEGSLDLAVDLLLQMPPTINHAPILSEPMVVMARRGHPDIRGSINLDTYLGQKHIQVSSRRHGFGVEDMALRRSGLTRHVRLRCEHYGAASRVVSRTDMLMTMPFSFASMANESLHN